MLDRFFTLRGYKVTFDTVDYFRKLFCGNMDAYGQFVEDKDQPEIKHKGRATTVTGMVTEKIYRDHLEGKTGLGICPINKEGLCTFTAIDIDDYDKDKTKQYLRIIDEYDFPIFPFLSKSGGLHLYTFYAEPIPASKAINNAKKMRIMLGLPKDTEIFPKQTKLSAGSKGNWINIPYFGGDNTSRKMLDGEGNPYTSMDVAIGLCWEGRKTEASFDSWFESTPLFDAPPCLQTIYLTGDTSDRNNYLFSLCCYLKAKYKEDFVQPLYEANQHLADPLSDKELEDTILKSHNKYSYSYRCRETPLCSFCDKAECKTRAFAVGDAMSELSFEQLIMYQADPPFYDWVVNGKPLRFTSESEIIAQQRFRELSMRFLGILPNRVKDDVWTEIINNALKNITVKDETMNINSELDLAKDAIKSFLLDCYVKKGNACTLEDAFYANAAFLSNLEDIIVNPKDIYLHLKEELQSASIGVAELIRILKEWGGQTSARTFCGSSIRVMVIPAVNLFDNGKDFVAWLEKKERRPKPSVDEAIKELEEKDL